MLRASPKPVILNKNSITVFESRHAPGFEMKMGKWDFDKLCFIRSGKGQLVSNTSNIRLRTEDALFLPAHEPHRFIDDRSDPITLIMVCFYPSTLQRIPDLASGYRHFRSMFLPMRPMNTAQVHRRTTIQSHLQRMIFEQTTGRDGYGAANWGMLVQLLVALARTAQESTSPARSNKGGRHFVRTLDFLDECFTEQIQIKNLATMAGISYRRYTTLFREVKGETVNAYITRLRVDFAKKRLLETENVLFSALDAGFGDLSHFYRLFKKSTGLTPRQFIEFHTTD